MRITGHWIRFGVCGAGVLLPAFLPSAHAAEIGYQLGIASGYSDNIRRTENNEKGEGVASAGLQFSLSEETRKLQADLVGNFSYQDYLDNSFDSELAGNFAGKALFSFVPERFEFALEDNFGQVLSNPFSPATPDNRENINYLTAGPNFVLGLGSRGRIELQGRYARTDYEKMSIDSDDRLAQLSLARLLSESNTVSLNTTYQDIQYDNSALNADYRQTDAFVRYNVEGIRTRVNADLGYTETDRDASSRKEDGLLARLSASRRISRSSTVSLEWAREFSSSGTRFAANQGAAPIGLASTPGNQTAQPFIDHRVSLGWDFLQGRMSWFLRGIRSDQNYDGNRLLDQTLTSGDLGIQRQLSKTTSLEFVSDYIDANFAQPNSDYTELSVGLRFAWQTTADTYLNVSYDRVDRNSDAVGGGYNENRFLVSFGYGRGSVRNAIQQRQFSVDAATAPTE